MSYLIGTILIVASVVLSLLAVVGYIATIRGNRHALTYARVGVYGAMFTSVAMWLVLVALFLTRRFDVQYVHDYSSSDMNTFYTLAATWGGQPGSFAIWVMFGALVASLLVYRTRHFEPYVLVIVMLMQMSITALMLISNPFVPFTDPNTAMIPATPPAEGQGLNPLLYNFWMIFHPPVLFVSYALAVVPFGFALGGLLRRDYTDWVTRAMPWTLAAWAFLGLALFLGAYWSYETLGWGGYWGWDPVENSSLVPWLLLSALLHTMLLQRMHGTLRRTNLLLAIITYMSVIYATYLTRSGVLTNFSVHSFVAEGLSGAMVAFIVVAFVSSLALWGLRVWDVPSRPLQSTFFSRDSFLVLTLITLVVLSLLITLGTSMPVISAIPGVGHSLQSFFGGMFTIDDGSALGGEPLTDGRFSLMPEFFKRTTPPLGLVMMMLLVVGPLTTWRMHSLQQIIRDLRLPFVGAIIGTVIALLLGVNDAMSLAFVGVTVLAAGSNVLTLIRSARISWLHTGAQIAHLGLCVLMIGVVSSSGYATPDERVVLVSEEAPTNIYGFNLTFHDWEATTNSDGNPNGRGVLHLTVEHNGQTFSARPELYFDNTMASTMQTPAIKNYWWGDVYISPSEYTPADDPNRPVLGMESPRQIGPYNITFVNFDVDEHSFTETGAAEVGAQLRVLYEGKEYEVIPKVNLTSNDEQTDQANPHGSSSSFEEIPAELPGGHEVRLKMFDPSQRAVFLTIDGLDEPIQPAIAVVTVSTKPFVWLVWLGSLLLVAGGVVAVVRRTIEGSLALQDKPAHVPHGVALKTS